MRSMTRALSGNARLTDVSEPVAPGGVDFLLIPSDAPAGSDPEVLGGGEQQPYVDPGR